MKILLIMGPSGSGKDTVKARLLKKDNRFKSIIPYTTRNMRPGEVYGREYFFVTDEEFEELDGQGKVIECRSYKLVNGEAKYFHCKEGLDGDYIYVAIGTIEVLQKFIEYFGSDIVIPIFIFVNDLDRIERCLVRERQKSKPDIEEMCRRFITDKRVDFELSKLKSIKGLRIIENDNIDNCVNNVIAVCNGNYSNTLDLNELIF